MNKHYAQAVKKTIRKYGCHVLSEGTLRPCDLIEAITSELDALGVAYESQGEDQDDSEYLEEIWDDLDNALTEVGLALTTQEGDPACLLIVGLEYFHEDDYDDLPDRLGL